MSFWSRNKNKKDTPTTTTSTPPPTTTSLPTTSAPLTNGTTIPSTGASAPATYSRANGITSNNSTSPPDSPSTITAIRSTTGNPSPWSMRKFRNANPFPRFGHAANVSAGREGEVYVFGGLVKEKRRNDLFVIDSASMTAYNISATGESPSPRLGHACILVGNAFIVFGGECATTELSHDDSLYLLNTSTRQWTRAVTYGPRPAPRYGHTLNILGSRLLVFGGQVEDYYFNDLVTFDLNTLNSPNARWELVQAVTDPPGARTGHVCLSLADKLIVFGGTDGTQWFNDTWFFDARSNSWLEIECSGHIPSPREGHGAALVGDVIYIFGGRGSDGRMLADLYAFKVTSRRWFSFQGIGIGPSARCGHSLTTISDKIIILGGESATSISGKDESTVAFVLETSKIRFPSDNAKSGSSSNRERARTITSPQPPVGRPQPASRGNTALTNASDSPRVNADEPKGVRPSRIRSPSPKQGNVTSRGPSENRDPSQSSSGQSSLRAKNASPMNAQIGGMAVSQPERIDRPKERPADRPDRPDARPNTLQDRPNDRTIESSTEERPPNRSDRSIETSTPVEQVKIPPQLNGFDMTVIERKDDVESTNGGDSPSAPKHSETHHDDNTPSLQSSPQPTSIEQLKKRLAWATTELALAQSRGYIPNEHIDEDDLSEFLGKNNFQVKETKLLQALLSTRHQLARVKELVKDQTRTASERISEAERQRDEALSDAAYVRARLAAAQSGDETGIQDDRASELGKKLVIALSMQSELTMKVADLSTQLSAEKAARKIAEDTASSHFEKFDDAERRRKEGSSRLEELRGKLSDTQRIASDERAKSIDHEATASNLRIETAELKTQVADLSELMDHQANAVKATKTAIQSAVERAESAENALQLERAQRLELQKEVIQLKQDLNAVETQQSSIDVLERQLSLAREEADAARNVMLNSLDNLAPRAPTDSTDYDGRIRTLQEHLEKTKSLHAESREAHDGVTQELSKTHERIAFLETAQSQSVREISTLQTRLSESLDQFQSLQGEHTKVRTHMAEVQRDLDASYVKHTAVKQLISERPASASPLRSTTATPDFANKIRDLERQLEESQQLREELEASQEQVMQNLSVASKRHKDATRRQREAEDRVKKLEEEIERASNRSVGSNSADIVDANRRVAEAEKKLVDSTVAFQDRLAQLGADHQSAMHYIKGTEKMISRMKEELTKYKSQNAFLQTELHELKRQSLRGSDDDQQGWRPEKERLMKEIEVLQMTQKTELSSASEQIKALQLKLNQYIEQRDVLKSQLADVQREFQASTERSKEVEAELQRLHDDNTNSRLENELALAKEASKRLEQENQQLETRAMEAEEKVSLLLDQVETSVDTYRRSIVPKRAEGNSPPISPRSSSIGNRTSVALDSLAHELDQLRSHWESSSHRYRLSTASSIGRESPTHTTGLTPFDFETSRVTADDSKVNGVHEHTSRWRDEIDTQPSHVRQVAA